MPQFSKPSSNSPPPTNSDLFSRLNRAGPMTSPRHFSIKLLILFIILGVLSFSGGFFGYITFLVLTEQEIPATSAIGRSLAAISPGRTPNGSAASLTDQPQGRTSLQNAWRRISKFFNWRSQDPPTLEEAIAEAPAGTFKPLTDAINHISDQLPCDTESECLSYCLDLENADQCQDLIQRSGYIPN